MPYFKALLTCWGPLCLSLSLGPQLSSCLCLSEDLSSFTALSPPLIPSQLATQSLAPSTTLLRVQALRPLIMVQGGTSVCKTPGFRMQAASRSLMGAGNPWGLLKLSGRLMGFGPACRGSMSGPARERYPAPWHLFPSAAGQHEPVVGCSSQWPTPELVIQPRLGPQPSRAMKMLEVGQGRGQDCTGGDCSASPKGPQVLSELEWNSLLLD